MLQVYVMLYSTFAVLQLGTNPQKKHIWITNTWLPVYNIIVVLSGSLQDSS